MLNAVNETGFGIASTISETVSRSITPCSKAPLTIGSKRRWSDGKGVVRGPALEGGIWKTLGNLPRDKFAVNLMPPLMAFSAIPLTFTRDAERSHSQHYSRATD